MLQIRFSCKLALKSSKSSNNCLGALGLSQLSIVMKSNTVELKLDQPIEQHLDLITLGDPTPEMRKVITAAHLIANTALNR